MSENNIEKLFAEELEKLYNKKYGKYMKIILDYVKENNLLLVGANLFNRIFDKDKKFNKYYKLVIASDEPFITANNLSNLLADNNLDISLYTIELNTIFYLNINYLVPGVFLFIIKKAYNNLITVKYNSDYDVNTYDYFIHLMYIYYILGNIEYNCLWDNFSLYRDKILDKLDLDYNEKNIENIYDNIPYKNPIMKYIFNNHKYFMCIGSLACNFIENTNKYLGTYQFLTCKDLNFIVNEIKTIPNVTYTIKPFMLYDKFHYKFLNITCQEKRFYFYDILLYFPVKIYDTIIRNEDIIHIADINIILCFLFNNMIYSPSYIHDRIKQTIKFILTLKKKDKSKYSPHDVDSYIGTYTSHYLYLKIKYDKESIFFKKYNPILYKKEFGEYRQIIKK